MSKPDTNKPAEMWAGVFDEMRHEEEQERGICGNPRGSCGLPCEACEGKPDPDWVPKGEDWVITGPDGARFHGDTPFHAAVLANRHRVLTDPEEAAKWLALIEKIQQENEAENARLMELHGSLDCPACGGSGHIGDTKPEFLAQKGKV